MKTKALIVLLTLIMSLATVSAQYDQDGRLGCTTSADCPVLNCFAEPCQQYSCVNGQCLITNTPADTTCTDSDGGLIYGKPGTAKGYLDSKKQQIGSATDYCVSNKTLQEYYCSRDLSFIANLRYDCPNGCSKGICLPKIDVSCPFLDCPAPPVNCKYVPGKDQNGCTTCGALVCEDPCPLIRCPSPPDGCRYESETVDGCATCGKLVCSCTDNDGGENIYKASDAFSKDGLGYVDNCDFLDDPNGILNEAVCSNGVAVAKRINCPGGTPYCNKAVCSREKPVCSDSDGGSNPKARGTVTEPRYADGPQYTDYCQRLSTKQPWNGCSGSDCGLREYYCTNPYVRTTYQDYKCPGGCSNGVCIQDDSICGSEAVCNRGDHGFIAGQAFRGCELNSECGPDITPEIINVARVSGNYEIKTDSFGQIATPDKGYLVEYWYGGAYNDVPHKSVNNYAFEGGDSGNSNAKYANGLWIVPAPTTLSYDKTWVYMALHCVDRSKCGNAPGSHKYRALYEKPSINPRLENYPKMFIQDNNFNGVLVVGDKASADHVIAISDILASLRAYTPENLDGAFTNSDSDSVVVKKITVGAVKLASEVKDINRNIISVGSSCNNAITSQIENYPANCLYDLEPGKGIIRMSSKNGYVHLVVKGYGDAEVREAAKVIANYRDYRLSGTEYIVWTDSKCRSDADCSPINCIKEPCPVSSCYDGACIITTCGNGVCETGENKCECNGMADSDECISGCPKRYCPKDCQTKKTCTDSDGGRNYFVKGDTSSCSYSSVSSSSSSGGGGGGGCGGNTDYCSGNNVVEFYCGSDNNVKSESVNCANGCLNGACGKEPKECSNYKKLDLGALEGEHLAHTKLSKNYVVLDFNTRGVYLSSLEKIDWQNIGFEGTPFNSRIYEPYVVWESQRYDKVYIYNIETKKYTILNNSLSPDIADGKVVFSSNGDIYLYDIKTETTSQIVSADVGTGFFGRPIITNQYIIVGYFEDIGNNQETTIFTENIKTKEEFWIKDDSSSFELTDAYGDDILIRKFASQNQKPSFVIFNLQSKSYLTLRTFTSFSGNVQASLDEDAAVIVKSSASGTGIDIETYEKPNFSKKDEYFVPIVRHSFIDFHSGKLSLIQYDEEETWKGINNYLIDIANCDSIACKDSDGGVNYFVKGTVTYENGGSNTDLCISKSRDGNWGNQAYSGTHVVEYSCPSSSNDGKEIYLCPNGCKDGACIKGSSKISILDHKTDKKYYGISDNVIISASVYSPNGNFPTIISDINRPDRQKEQLVMQQGSCIAEIGSSSATCHYEGTYRSSQEGNYYFAVKEQGSTQGGAYGSFSKLDLVKASNYIITSNIGGYRLINLYHEADNYYDENIIEIYGVTYQNSYRTDSVFVYIFSDRNSLDRLLDEALEQIPYSTLEINGNKVYLLDEGYGESLIVWTKENILVIYSNGYDGIEETTEVKMEQINSITGAATTEEETEEIIFDVVLSEYLQKHPSDIQGGNAENYKLKLLKGWNLFSAPIIENQPYTFFSQYKTDCVYESPLWTFSNIKKEYYKTEAVTNVPSEGYWIKVKNDCYVTVTGDALNDIGNNGDSFLYAGWNIFGKASKPLSASDALKNCKIEKGPYWYDLVSKQYAIASAIEPGKGYVVKVGNDCSIGSDSDKPPAFPLDISATGNAVWRK